MIVERIRSRCPELTAADLLLVSRVITPPSGTRTARQKRPPPSAPRQRKARITWKRDHEEQLLLELRSGSVSMTLNPSGHARIAARRVGRWTTGSAAYANQVCRPGDRRHPFAATVRSQPSAASLRMTKRRSEQAQVRHPAASGLIPSAPGRPACLIGALHKPSAARDHRRSTLDM